LAIDEDEVIGDGRRSREDGGRSRAAIIPVTTTIGKDVKRLKALNVVVIELIGGLGRDCLCHPQFLPYGVLSVVRVLDFPPCDVIDDRKRRSTYWPPQDQSILILAIGDTPTISLYEVPVKDVLSH